jgi:ubiquinone/menaquinone biosynthesis C-methylase UbiE
MLADSRLRWALVPPALALVFLSTSPIAAAPQQATASAQEKAQDHGHDHDHPAPPRDGTYQGRLIAQVMSYLGASWLLRDSRVDEEQPDRMLAALEIQPGMVVADVGAGVGYHSLKLSRLVGPNGTVYATDVQPQMIQMLKRRVNAARVRNVRPVLCTQDNPGLPESAIDLILMVDVYHEMANPGASVQALRRALKPGGRLVLVEFRGEDPTVPIKPEHKMTVAQVRKEIEPLGFTFQTLHDFLPWQHILVFEKPAEPNPQPQPQPEAPNRPSASPE